MLEHRNASLQLFLVVWIFLRFLGVICYDRWVLSEGHHSFLYILPLKLVFIFEIWTKWGVLKKLLRNRGGFLRKEWGGGGFQIVSSVFLKKSTFSLLLEHFFVCDKYSHLR